MRYIIYTVFFGVLMSGNCLYAQDTLKVVNWNLEFFGDKSSQLPEEMQKSKIIMNQLSADVYALVEIVNVDSLRNLVGSLNGSYNFIVSQYGSFATSPSSPDYDDAQKIAFVYNTTKLRNVSGRPFLKNSTGGAYYNWSSGRFPFFVATEVKDGNGNWQPINFIVLHAKAFADNKSCLRRYDGGREMKDSLDKLFANDKIIILGDYNDDFDVSICGGPSNYEYLVKDTFDNNSYRIPTLNLSRQGVTSIANYPSFIDHVVITNDMENDYINNSARLLKNEVENWVMDYTDFVSDHYPVETKYVIKSPTYASSFDGDNITTTIFPNPVSDVLYISSGNNELERYEIFSSDGRMVGFGNIDDKITSIATTDFPENIYFIKLIGKSTLIKKIIVHH